MRRDDVLEVVMVGGSTRTLLVSREMVGDFLSCNAANCPSHTVLTPDEVVAIGALSKRIALSRQHHKPDHPEMLPFDVSSSS